MAGCDGPSLQREAHKLMGSLGTMAAEPARQLASDLEAAATSEDYDRARQIVDELVQELDRVTRALEAIARDSQGAPSGEIS